MIIYRYPYGDSIGEYILICRYRDKSLIYSLKNKSFPPFYFIFNYYIVDRFIVRDEIILDNFYQKDMRISYLSFKTIMTQSINHLDSNSDKYKNIVARRSNFGQRDLFNACNEYFTTFSNIGNINICKDTEIDEIISKFESNLIV